MPNRGRARRSNANRRVAQILRSHHVTTSPTWYQIRTRSTDPPAYNNDPMYQRKVRFIGKGAAAGYEFTIDTIGKQSKFDLLFAYIMIERIDVYGQADASTIQCTVKDLKTIQPSYGITKNFTDAGVDGSRRSHISIAYPAKDNRLFKIADPAILMTLSSLSKNGTAQDYDYVIDIHCKFSGLGQNPPVFGESPTLHANVQGYKLPAKTDETSVTELSNSFEKVELGTSQQQQS